MLFRIQKKQEDLYRKKYDQFFSTLNKIHKIADDYYYALDITYDTNYSFKQKLIHTDLQHHYDFNFSKFPYSPIAKCVLVAHILHHVLG